MDIRSIKTNAANSLAAASYDPKKLAVLHAGAALLLTLVMTVLNYFLSRSIDNTAGLSGIGTRTVLETVTSLLSIASAFVLPFWEIGFLYAAMGMARRENVSPMTLTEGFRRIGPVLRLQLLQLLLYIGVAMACMYAATFVFFFTSLSNSMMETLQALLDSGVTAEELMASDAMFEQLLPTMIPVYVVFGVLFAVVAIPLFYRFRMASYAVMDTQTPGALAAMRDSSRMMRGSRLALAKLDLSFWWYYAAQLVITAVAYGDLLLPALGITLPFGSDAAMFIFFVVQLVLQLVLAYSCGSYVQTAYAHCYDLLKNKKPASPKPIPPELLY